MKESKIVCSLLKSLESREEKLVRNSVYKMALFLDPRFFFLLSESDKTEARSQLKKLWDAFETIQEPSTEENPEPIPKKIPSKLEAFLEVKQRQLSSSPMSSSSRLDTFLKSASEKKNSRSKSSMKAYTEIESFSIEPQPVSTNLLAYWHGIKNQFPYVYILAMIVLSVPSSQTSVERLFSSMNFVFNNRRSNLSQDNLENILLIRSNYNFDIEDYMNLN